jgi:hypothetical protein
MAFELQDIEEICTTQKIAPGLETKLRIVPICGVTSIPTIPAYVAGTTADDAAHTIADDIVLKADYFFAEWTFRKTDAQYKAEKAGEEDAEIVNVTASMYIPKITPLKTYLMNQTINGRFLVLISDRNNPNPRAIGEIGNGAMVKVTEQTNPKNGYLLEITGINFDEYPAFYSGAIPLIA